MAFLEIRFPLDISYGATGGPGYKTDVVALGSGFESRNQNWLAARGSWDVAKACKNATMRRALLAFFRVAKGRAHGFRFRDWSDYKVVDEEGVLVATATPDVYQLVKRYQNTAGQEDRTIYKPVTAAIYEGVTLLVAGVDYTLDATTGLVTVAANSPPIVPTSWLGEFDIPVRFDTDKLDLTVEGNKEFFRASSIQVVELRQA